MPYMIAVSLEMSDEPSFGFIGIQERFSLELKTKLSRIDFEIPESCKVFIQCFV